MASGIISFDPVAQGSAFLMALTAAGIFAVRRPDGLFVSDTAAASAITDAEMLPQAQALALEALMSEYARRIASGRAYSVPGGTSHTYQIDDVSPSPARPSSQAQIAHVAVQAARALKDGVTGTPWDSAAPIPFFFADAADVQVPMTAQEAYDFGAAIGQYCTSLVLRSLQLKAAIAAATTVSAVQAIDLTAGWPT